MSTDLADQPPRAPAQERRAAPSNNFVGGVAEVLEGTRNWRVWYLMGSAEMRRRFERSKLGPLWIVVSTGVVVLCIAAVWSALWSAELSVILPFITVGLVTWQFIAATTGDATIGFPSYASYFVNQYMAPSNVIFSVVYKNLTTYLMTLIVPLIVCLVFGVPIGWSTLMVFPGLALLIYSLFCFAYIVAILCARYRDVVQVVQNVMQLAFFTTPILWQPDLLSEKVQRLVAFNPFASLLAVVRDPLIGEPVSPEEWGVSIGVAVVLTLIMIPLVGRAHRRVVFWL